jgi:ATP-dependent helicase/nuclease subunit A
MNRPELRDAAARKLIRERLDINLLVEAGAGSGKTESLAGRMVETVACGICSVEEIAAVTFTKKAASELRGRFRVELERQAAEELDPVRKGRILNAMYAMERMFAGTIHAFCAHLLRERPVEAGLAPGFREIEEPEDAVLRRRFWREYIDRAQSTRLPALLALLAAEVKPSDLDDAFRTICAHPDVEFPAGYGKIPDINQPWTALDHFWRDLQKLCPPIAEESTCKVQALMSRFSPRFRNADRKRVAVLARLLGQWAGSTTVTQKWWSGQGKKAGAVIDDFRVQTVEPFLRAWREYVYHIAITLLLDARDWAAGQRRRAALMNFADLLFFAARLVCEQGAVREALQRKYRRIFVDEFQDTDPMQAELLFLLAAEPGEGDDWTRIRLRPGALFLVGDPKQSIYRFRRADIEVYLQARLRIEQGGGQIVSLTTCFRSGIAICGWANEVFSSLFPEHATAHQPGFDRLDPGADDPKTVAGAVRLVHADSVGQREVPAADADAIAAYIRSEVESGKRSWGDFLVLTRKKVGRLGVYTDAMEAARIPYEVSGSGSLLESEYVQTLVAVLFALTHADDGIALAGVLRGPCFGLSDPHLYEFCKNGGVLSLSVPVNGDDTGPVASALRMLLGWRPLVRGLPAGAAIEVILEQSGLLAKAAASSAGGGEAGKLVYALDCLRAACESGMTLGDAVTALEESSEDDESDSPVLEPGRREVVRIMNLHKAKGLEAKVVFLADPLGGVKPRADLHIEREAGKARGYLAITKAKGEWGKEIIALPSGWDTLQSAELGFVTAEETRLLYVAATRARETLVVSQWEGKPRSVVPPWRNLDRFLKSRPLMKKARFVQAPAAPMPDLSERSRREAEKVREIRRAGIKAPCFEAVAISSLASRGPSGPGIAAAEGPSGGAWGALIHTLLEYAATNLSATRADLEAIARWQAADNPALTEHIATALDTLDKLRASEFWQQVTSAQQRLTEVPIGATWDDQRPPRVIAKGVIDLVLRTHRGWRIIDYKTDSLSVDQLVKEYREQVRAYARIWEKITKERVAFAGIYSVRDLQLSGDVRGEAVTA